MFSKTFGPHQNIDPIYMPFEMKRTINLIECEPLHYSSSQETTTV